MILNLERFVEAERAAWRELDAVLADLERRPRGRLSVAEAKRLHTLHRRVAADLARISTFSGEPELRREVEALVARSHAELHAISEPGGRRFAPWRWASSTFPRTFRAHAGLFVVACAVFAAGACFGALVLVLDPAAKESVLPFPHLMGSPSERVAEEELRPRTRGASGEASFSGMLMTHNTRVAVLEMALGATYGVGTVALLFYNGVVLGMVSADYAAAGETPFLVAWLLPHGSVEIPAFLVAGQAGLLLASAMIGGRGRKRFAQRLSEAGPDLVTLIGGTALMLVWAGVVEAFLSQHHEPAVPYWAKTAFGAGSVVALAAYLALAGRGGRERGGGG